MVMKAALAAALAVILVPRVAFADDIVVLPPPINIHISSNSSLRTDTRPNVELRLPPGYFLDEPTWNKLDTEVRRLQEQEIRLTAENKKLREYSAGYFPMWAVVGASLAVGTAAGIWIGLKL